MGQQTFSGQEVASGPDEMLLVCAVSTALSCLCKIAQVGQLTQIRTVRGGLGSFHGY